MPTLLETSPYRYDQPAAQDLHVALAELYPDVDEAILAAAKIGIRRFDLSTKKSPFLLWKDILDLASRRKNGLRKLLQSVVADHPDSTRREFFDALLNDDAKPPLNHDGIRPKKTPEALLYHDDLTIPIGEVSGLIDALRKMQAIETAVCKLEVETATYRGTGTGFRIGRDLLLTNHHVVFLEKENPISVVATFGYQSVSAGKAVVCDITSAAGEPDPDWAVVRTAGPIDAGIPIIPLQGTDAPVKGEYAFVIQHPAGDRKRLAYARNHVSFVDGEVVHYTSDTQTGSSGSPVFNRNGSLIALHRAGGDPQQVPGRDPVRMNEGVRVERVVEGLKKKEIKIENA